MSATSSETWGHQAETADRAGVAPRTRVAAPASTTGLPVEIGFLAAYGLSPAALSRVAATAAALGVTADRVVQAERLVDEDRFYRYLAHHLGMGFTSGPLRLAPGCAPDAAAVGVVPLAGPKGTRFAIAPAGRMLALLLRQRLDRHTLRTALVITTPSNLAAEAGRATGPAIAEAASYGLARLDPALSAAPTRAGAWLRALYAALLLAVLGVVLGAAAFEPAVRLGASVLLLAVVALRLCVAAQSCAAPAAAAAPLSDAELPAYTVLVPLYDEARMVPQLVAALEKIDYPRVKLDIKFVVEDDDITTLAALRAQPLGPSYAIVVAPPGAPRTKPRALNVALPLARGEMIAVFDAEDEPAPDQLRAAAAQMRRAAPDVACLQARLVLYNVSDSWLSRCFALDYAALFDVTNVGLAALGLPLPLGGTSNHFRADVLREVGGWDAWNVTEDADLGLRLARFGYRTEVLATTTAEEAPVRLANWFRQRRRWFKGWQQTQVTLARSPAGLVAALGRRRALMTVLLLLAQVQAPLLWPVATLLLVRQLVVAGLPTPATPLDLLVATAWTSLVVAGVGLTLLTTVLGMRRRGLGRLWPWLPTLVAYKLLVSLAAWASVIDFVRRPHRWDKTEHGLTRRADRPQADLGATD